MQSCNRWINLIGPKKKQTAVLDKMVTLLNQPRLFRRSRNFGTDATCTAFPTVSRPPQFHQLYFRLLPLLTPP